jgi:gliding motility-associated lipoprotein GldH
VVTEAIKGKVTIRMRRRTNLLLVAFVVLALASCDKTRILEKNQPIKSDTWAYDDVKVFEAEIADTAISYNIYVQTRHSFQFEWRNMWVDIETIFPDSTSFHKRVNLLLSEPDGQWHGECLGDNCDMQVLIQSNALFPQPGKYKFKIKQDMRVNPLPKVKSIGMRIEKYTAEAAQ